MTEERQQRPDSGCPSWSMSQEREFMENLLGQRFSFFLVFFSLVMAGSLSAKTPLQVFLLLGFGLVICVRFAAVLGRSQEKLDLILEKHIFKDKSHPATIIDEEARKCGSRRRLIGIWIPRFCCGALCLEFARAFVRLWLSGRWWP